MGLRLTAAALVRVLQVPKLMELIGLGYSAWFTYRYLLFKVRGWKSGPGWEARAWL